jgi:hypothetical protein
MATKEEEEWARAAKAGRKRRLPLIVAVLVGTVVAVAGFAVEVLVAEDMQDRANAGEIVYERRGPKATVGALVLPVAGGAIAFLVVFKLLGGKLAAEYERALRR